MEKVHQAGAIALRVVDGSVRLLVVTAKKNHDHWIFPKGHIEAGETAVHAAVRELEEETGFTGEILDYAGSAEFDYRGRRAHVDYYLVRQTGQVGPGEDRRRWWCSYEEALELLSFENSKQVLIEARLLIERHGDWLRSDRGRRLKERIPWQGGCSATVRNYSRGVPSLFSILVGRN